MAKKKRSSIQRTVLIIGGIILLFVILTGIKKSRTSPRISTESTVVLSDTDVPGAYRDLYEKVGQELDDFAKKQNNADTHKAIKGAELLTANTHRGEDLLKRQAMSGNTLFLDHLQKLGVKGVSVSLQYPILSEDYPQSEEYWQFYKELVAEIRKRDLILHMDIGPIFKEKEYSDAGVDYSSISKEEYLKGKKEIAVRVANELQPDYLTLVNEPDTEAAIVGFSTTAEEYSRFISDIAKDIEGASSLIGAGSGTWDSTEYVNSFVQNPDVDFIDLHIYPLTNGVTDYLHQAVQMTQTAKANGKRVIIGEVWLYKAAPKDLVLGEASTEIFSRDPFSFWSTLDQKMLKTVFDMAEANAIEYVSPFWSQYFFSYLDYDHNKNKSYLKLQSQVNKNAVQNMFEGKISDTGAFYSDLK